MFQLQKNVSFKIISQFFIFPDYKDNEYDYYEDYHWEDGKNLGEDYYGDYYDGELWSDENL